MTATEPAGRWLQRLVQGQRRLLGLALVLALTSAVLFILQSWIIADLFGRWLQSASGAGQGAPGAGWWPILLLCPPLRPLLPFFRERLCQQARWRGRHALPPPLLQRPAALATARRARNALRQLLLQRLAALGPARRALGPDAQLGSQLLEQVDALDGYISRYQVQRQLVLWVPLLLLLATAWHSLLAAALLLVTAP